MVWGITFATLRVFINRRKLRVGDGEQIDLGLVRKAKMLTWGSLCSCRCHPFNCLLLNIAFMYIKGPKIISKDR